LAVLKFKLVSVIKIQH